MTVTDVILLIIIILIVGLIYYFGIYKNRNSCDKVYKNKKELLRIKKEIEKDFEDYDKKGDE